MTFTTNQLYDLLAPALAEFRSGIMNAPISDAQRRDVAMKVLGFHLGFCMFLIERCTPELKGVPATMLMRQLCESLGAQIEREGASLQ